MKFPWQDFETWKDYGIEHEYDKKCKDNLKSSKVKKERSWHNKGRREDWLSKFNFCETRPQKSVFQDYKTWRIYGLDKGYNKMSKASLKKSKNKEERNWFDRGQRMKWVNYFKFKEIRINWRLFNKSMWIGYGLAKGYSERNPRSLEDSKDKQEKSWYQKGADNNWLKLFKFKKMWEKRLYKSLEDWRGYGLKKGYDSMRRIDIANSKNKGARSWYGKGAQMKWLRHFSFAKTGKWPKFEDWERYGIEQGYNRRNSKSLFTSENKEDRSWYGKGVKKHWLKIFNFQKKKLGRSTYQERLESFIKETPEAEAIASFASANGYAAEAANIFIKLWPERFTSASKLALSLPGSIKGIGHSLKPFSFEETRKIRKRIKSLPQSIQYQLEDILFSIVCDQYQVKFNKNPKKTINELELFVRQKQSEETKSLVLRVLEYYNEICDFDVPGYGNLK